MNLFVRQASSAVHRHLHVSIHFRQAGTDLQASVLRVVKDHIDAGALGCVRGDVVHNALTDLCRIRALVVTTFDDFDFDVRLIVGVRAKTHLFLRWQ